MTLAAVKKLAIKLPPKQRVQLANALYESIPPMRGPSSISEMEARLEEVESGKVKPISGKTFLAELDQMMGAVRCKRRGQRG
jgi:putative addiction module component (TIGR02574 family)